MRFIILFISVFSFHFTHAQLASIKGKVGDIQDQSIPGATVILYHSADSTMAKGDVSKEDGRFQLLGLKPGAYWMKVSYIGYDEYVLKDIQLIEDQEFIVPAIKLAASSVELGGVEVKAQRALIEMHPDKTVFNVDGSINATGNTALELLRKSPGVVVDNNDNIMLSGKNGVKVFIDGKPTYMSSEELATRLKAMQSTEIDAIEIITNPSAKYEAEGNAGIINIKLKKDKNLGTNATLNLGYNIGIYSKYNGSVSLNHRNKKVNVFGSYSYNQGVFTNWMDIYNEQNNLIIDEKSVTRRKGNFQSARIGSDFFLNKNNTVGFLVEGYFNDRDWTNHSEVPIINKSTNEEISFLDARSENDMSRQNFNANINYSYSNDKRVSWNADLDWGKFNNNTDTYQPNYYIDRSTGTEKESRIFFSNAPTDIDIYVGKVDYERPWLKGTFGAGAKSSMVVTDNTYDYYQLINEVREKDLHRSNNFKYTENVNAVYGTYSRKIKTFSINLGLRVEQTNSEGILTSEIVTENDNVKRSYVDYFPSGGVAWQKNKDHQFRLNYSRRIDRPDYQDLNPFEWKLSEISFRRGNPFLRPQYSHNISIAHTFKYRLTTSLTYTHTNDFFGQITDSVEVNKSYLEPVNLDNQEVISLAVSLPISPFKWWNMFTNTSVFYQDNEAASVNGRTIDIQATTFNIYHQSTFLLPKDYSFQVSGWFNSPSVWGGMMRTRTNYSIDIGVQKKLFSGRGSLKATFSDVFNTASWSSIQDLPGYYMDISGGWESRQFRVNFSYLFGNQQVKKIRDRKTGLDSEKNRIKE